MPKTTQPRLWLNLRLNVDLELGRYVFGPFWPVAASFGAEFLFFVDLGCREGEEDEVDADEDSDRSVEVGEGSSIRWRRNLFDIGVYWTDGEFDNIWHYEPVENTWCKLCKDNLAELIF